MSILICVFKLIINLKKNTSILGHDMCADSTRFFYYIFLFCIAEKYYFINEIESKP